MQAAIFQTGTPVESVKVRLTCGCGSFGDARFIRILVQQTEKTQKEAEKETGARNEERNGFQKRCHPLNSPIKNRISN